MSDIILRYVVQGQLAALNDHDNANRTNRYGGASLKKQMTDLVATQLKNKQPITEPCYITFFWHYSTRHDFDNIRFGAKYLLDGMVKAGILPNDNQKWVLGFGGDIFVKATKGSERVGIEVRMKNDRVAIKQVS